MSRKWIPCPECTSVGQPCRLCDGFSGWYTGPKLDMTDVDSLIQPLPRKPAETLDGASITADNMTNELATELVESIDSSDLELNDWETEFVGGLLGRTFFSTKQKAVILKIAKRGKLL